MQTRLAMLGQFLAIEDIDIILIQEVGQCSLESLRGYEAHINIGTNGRGMAIVAREGIPLRNVARIPSGRGIAAELQGVGIVNIFAPSGAEKKQEREVFFNIELPHLLATIPTKMILGGDFNCVLSKSDCTGHYNYSRALNALVSGYALIDMWEANPERGIYTHYSRQGASRLDRIYVTRNLSDRKKGIETVVAAFTDHLAVILRMALDVDITRRGRRFWKMNAALMQDAQFQAQLRLQWKRRSQQRKYYSDIVTWWERSAKNKSGNSLYGKERKNARKTEKWKTSTIRPPI